MSTLKAKEAISLSIPFHLRTSFLPRTGSLNKCLERPRPCAPLLQMWQKAEGFGWKEYMFHLKKHDEHERFLYTAVFPLLKQPLRGALSL